MSTNHNNELTVASKDELQKTDEFSTSFLASLTPLENKQITGVIDSFMANAAAQLANFIGKKVEFEFETIEDLETKNIFLKNDKVITSFNIANQQQLGLILFDNSFIQMSVDMLFGYDGEPSNPSALPLGKCTIKLVQKMAEISLEALKGSIDEYIKFEPTILKTSQIFREINCQNFPEQAYQLSFKISCRSHNYHLNLVLPQQILEKIAFPHNVDASGVPAQEDRSRENLRKEVIDSSIVLVAMLPEIKVNLLEVVNLKPGDLIPIGDPAQVILKIGDRKVFKALVGQANTARVVKIIEKFNQATESSGII